VYLGSERWVRKNWERLSQVRMSRLARCRRLLSQVSYRGRVLIINNLAASSLWLKLPVLNPPPQLFPMPLERLSREGLSGFTLRC
jgi:hypothetical protein